MLATFTFFIDEVLWVKNDWLREFFQLYKERIRQQHLPEGKQFEVTLHHDMYLDLPDCSNGSRSSSS